MRTAIIGLQQSGKTTLAGAVTGQIPDAATLNQSHQTTVKVPDSRLDLLAKLYNPKKVTEATIEFIDVPGFSLADHTGHRDLKRHLPLIRQSDLLVLVVRAFENPQVPSYRNRVDPDADLRELHDELILTDLETVTNRLERLEKTLKKPVENRDLLLHEQAVLKTCNAVLEETTPLSKTVTREDDLRFISGLGLLTLKPRLELLNVSEDQAAGADPEPGVGADAAIKLCARTELDISELDPSDRAAFLEDLGVERPARDRLIQRCYELLGYISFLTGSPTEVRAWTIPKGSDALTAAGKIHSDLARGFIRAETVAFSDLVERGDMKAAKAAGKVRQEGKSYIVQDGDVINFKFNV